MNIKSVFLAAMTAFVVAGCSRGVASPTSIPPADTIMGGISDSMQPRGLVPPVKGFYKGGEVNFIHTEASESQVASMLTRMMGPQVILVPSLAQAPQSALANVYAFTNGVKGNGPFGFQADVFDSVPGDPGYTPLRAVNLVTWKDGASPRVLRSAEEVRDSVINGRVTVMQQGVVVNMPMLTWPGGQR